jgi:hypothetical protein
LKEEIEKLVSKQQQGELEQGLEAQLALSVGNSPFWVVATWAQFSLGGKGEREREEEEGVIRTKTRGQCRRCLEGGAETLLIARNAWDR